MGENFENEVKKFEENFKIFHDKRIVLYGIGRRTATLVSHKVSFNFVGLMDRDPENIGKTICGLPIVSLTEAEEKADLIVINAPRTYWEVIYKRIQNSKIPVFFHNGERASLKADSKVFDNPYWEESLEKLRITLEPYEVVSFDLYDTLISRKVIKPEDVFLLLNWRLHSEGILLEQESFIEMRNRAVNHLPKYYSLDELYEKILQQNHLNPDVVEKIKQLELELEREIIVGRTIMLDLMKELMEQGKTVYIVSDMYLSKEVIYELLEMNGLQISQEHILVSNELKAEKRDGTLWEFYKNNIVKDKLAIHIGDNQAADIEKPREYGVDSYYVMGVSDMMRNSSIRELEELVLNELESLQVGIVLAQIFNNPFSLCPTKGKFVFSSFVHFGYAIWGNVVNTFISWLHEQGKNRGINRFLFLSRDGFLLKKNYKYYCDIYNENMQEAEYLYVSRRIANIANIINESDVLEWANFPYIGKFSDYLRDRFSICAKLDDVNAEQEIQLPKDWGKVVRWISQYRAELEEVIKKERDEYLQYIKSIHITEADAIVDTGFFGSIQGKLDTLVGKKLLGFYFNCDCTPQNALREQMFSCFQNPEDEDAMKSNLRRKVQFVESMFTAPYGMVLSVNSKGKPNCAPDGWNQKYFKERLLINEGIQTYISDIHQLEKFITRSFNSVFADEIFGILINNCEMNDDIKNIFVWDDILFKKREMPIWE